jgi:2-dehydro-3-deoxygluconokinase
MIFSAVNIAKKHKVLVVFDLNMRTKLWSAEEAKPVMEELMISSDYILPGLEDLRLLYGEKWQEKDFTKYLHDLGCEKIILKLGKEGAMLSLPSGDKIISGYPVENPVDLMGAGDAFAAGFISGILKSMELKEAIDLANIVASLSIQLPGNIESLPTWDEVIKFKKGEKIVKR